jgi:hypothetical protein
MNAPNGSDWRRSRSDVRHAGHCLRLLNGLPVASRSYQGRSASLPRFRISGFAPPQVTGSQSVGTIPSRRPRSDILMCRHVPWCWRSSAYLSIWYDAISVTLRGSRSVRCLNLVTVPAPSSRPSGRHLSDHLDAVGGRSSKLSYRCMHSCRSHAILRHDRI